MAALRRSGGSALASFGRTSESGESGTPSSPTAVRSSKRPATLPSESSVAAVIWPLTSAVRLKVTVAESPGEMDSIGWLGAPLRIAPRMLREFRLRLTKFAGDDDV